MHSLKDSLTGPASERALEDLCGQYRTSGIGLMLGLGVSCRSGLPDWETITARVMDAIDGGPETFQLLKDAGYSLPAILSWASVQAAGAFDSLLRSALYRDLDPAFTAGLTGAELRDRVRASNPTLAAVGAFVAGLEGSRVVSNRSVRAVMTTNADTLLRYYTRKAFQTDILRTVERVSAGPRAGCTNLYYLHGMLRFDSKYRKNKEAPDQLVFTDLQYYQAYRNPVGMFTYTPLFLFREMPFLFIGTRITDDNIRRLLYWSQAEIAAGYAAEGEPVPAFKQLRHYALLLSGDSDRAAETLLLPLGVRPIWYRSHDCIPAILRHIYGEEHEWEHLYGPAA